MIILPRASPYADFEGVTISRDATYRLTDNIVSDTAWNRLFGTTVKSEHFLSVSALQAVTEDDFSGMDRRTFCDTFYILQNNDMKFPYFPWIVDEYGRTTSYTYNEKRQCTKEETVNGSLKMKAERTYSGGLVTSEEDERGNANNYTHDSCGFTTKVVSPNGSGNSYAYSNFDLSKVTAVKDSTIKNSISYASGRISKVVDDEVEYRYNYDDFGKVTKVLRGPAGGAASEIKSVAYDEFNTAGSLGVTDAVTKVSVEYANGYENASFYDKAGRLLLVKEGTAVKETCTYLADGTLSQRIDNYSGMTYTYSESGNTITENYKKGSEQILTVSHYDDTAKMKRLVYSHSGDSDPYTQKTDDFGRMTELVTPLGTYTYTYDGLGRVTAKTLESGSVTVAKETYLYNESSDSGYTSPLKKRITYKDNSWDGYTCDGNGLIKNIVHSPGAGLRTYSYDGMNRLGRENIKGHKTATYEYDKAGNLTCRKEYDYHGLSLDNRTPNKTVTYTYQNGRMTSYDGESCVYDENGNPTTYRGKTLTWTRGRLLETYPSLASPEETWTFTYNADGIRVGKSAPGTTTTYGVDGERIVYEKTNGQIKRYFYDESGIAGFEYSGQKYVFRKNLQGDVVGICSSSGALIGEYVYDAWGNLLEEPTNGVLLANPFRYRGYYYDSSIGLYYLNSRYYDPETGRFLNEDLVSYLEPETIGGINLYAYCLNDPVNNIDPSGHLVMTLLIAMGIGAAIGGISSAITGAIAGKRGLYLFLHSLGGAVLGGVLGGATTLGGLFGIGAISSSFAALGFMGSVAASFGAGVLSYGLQEVWSVDDAEWDWGDAAAYGGIAATQGAFAFGVGAVLGYSGNWQSQNKKPIKFPSTSNKALGPKISLQQIRQSMSSLRVNVGQMMLRSFLKGTFSSSWGLLRKAV